MNSQEHMPNDGFTPASYEITLNGKKYTFQNPEPTPIEIMDAVGIDSMTNALILIRPGEQNRILPYDENQDLRQPGIENFTFASTKRRYEAYVDETAVYFDNSDPTGEDLLHAIGKNSKDYALTQILPGVDDVFIASQQRVDLKKLGIERFTAVIKGEVTIFVNTIDHKVHGFEISFEEVVQLAYSAPASPEKTYTVKYRNGTPNRPEGSLVAGGKVRIKEGMIFNVTRTNKS